MPRRAVTVAAVAACIALAVALALAGRDEAHRTSRPRPAPRGQGPGAPPPAPPRPQFGHGKPVGAQLHRRVQLRERPGGRVVRALGPRTGYGSERVLWVVARRGSWLGVLSQYMPNSRAGWIPAAAATLLLEPYTLHVDLSERRLVVRHDGRAVRRIRVAVGRPGTDTPTGRFAVTDLLRVPAGSAYGCCALALTGRQPNVPQGWGGGDRIAIHGTSNEATLGTAASSGCLRAAERDMRWLLARIPAGAPVRISA